MLMIAPGGKSRLSEHHRNKHGVSPDTRPDAEGTHRHLLATPRDVSLQIERRVAWLSPPRS